MPGKERDPQIPFDILCLLKEEHQARRLIESFGNQKWEYDQFWTDHNGEFLMVLKSPSGKKWIEYQDHGTSPKGSCVIVDFWDGEGVVFSFRQNVGKGRSGRIENHIIVPRYEDEDFDPEWGWGIHYWPDGTMGPLRNIKGLPRKIDMEKTVNTFIEQIIKGKFGRPLLVLPKK